MSKFAIVNKLTRGANRIALSGRKHGPEILVIGGVILGITSAVMACKATLKIDEINKETKENIERMDEALEKGVTESGLEYTEEDYKNDKKTMYIQTAVTYAKVYGPAVLLGTASVVSILGGHRILHKRVVGLTAAYTALDSSFKQYRGRVIDRFGEELDRELRFNIKSKEVEETVVNEDGTETTVTNVIDVIENGSNRSPYSFCFDECSPNWTKDPEWNKMFLLKQQNYWNDRLKRKGHVVLNEVLDSIGIDRTKAGAVTGWVYKEGDTEHGDNFIDFGIFDIHSEAARRFVNGYERSVWLDFNVDGVIWDQI